MKKVKTQEIAAAWRVNRTTVVRIMRRCGFDGMKTGKSKQCARFYDVADIKNVETLMRKNANQ
ncbi:MAG: hypothetical protein LBK71_06130 [Verrucomicrobiales bacterium]|jgi:hypothetical protein|nr:hypothetical protein [Verrucomicrobiales bacterium]